jgi:phosphoglycerol transferase MdoB-like AlkP superfamily enzyme
MRGGATTAIRPITISNANQYVNRPTEAAVVLNTTFSMLRTIGKKSFTDPAYYSQEELNKIYSPIKNSKSTPINIQDSTYCSAINKKQNNIVVLIVESFGREFIGKYNENLDGGNYKGYTTFMDSLYDHCLSFDYTFSNGRKSIDGMPSILSSIPMFVEPFFLTPSSLNELSSIAKELKSEGYHSAFFHGAENGSMGFMAFAKAIGFDEYLGRTEYDADPRFNGEKDFDGTWAIWDEPFLQFYATKMSEMKEPFVTAVFTASSHHPFVIPEEYKNIYKEEDNNVIHKCIRYTDNAIRHFFETAKKEPWFQNTLFVITSDHTNQADHKEYMTDLGLFGSPILFYDPSGILKPGRRHCIAQQIDIMPTVLSYLGYDKPYIAFGKDLLTTNDKDTWAVNYNNGIYQYIKGDFLLQFDGQNVKAIYNIKKDWMLTNNLKDKVTEQNDMEREVKAIIQSYMERMIEDELVVK